MKIETEIRLINGYRRTADRLQAGEYVVYNGVLGEVVAVDPVNGSMALLRVIIGVETSWAIIGTHQRHEYIVERKHQFSTIRVEVV